MLNQFPNTFKKLKKLLFYAIAVSSTLIIIAIIVMNIMLKNSINEVSTGAIAIYHKDTIESLLMLIESDNFTLKEKNGAIETLGFIADKRALTKLESIVTNKKCNHRSDLCQYEIQKAIRKIKGEYYIIFGIFYIEKKFLTKNEKNTGKFEADG